MGSWVYVDADRMDRLAELFERARGLAGEERNAWLAEACGGDTELEEEVRSLLAEHDSDDGTLESGRDAALLSSARAGGARAAFEIPGFAILSILGEGGQGAVYEAEQHRPRRTVALKVVRVGLGGPEAVRRFEREAETLARLHHPGIAIIHESGVTETDHGPLPWFAMELVRGLPLIEHANRKRLSREGRLDLLAQVCDAVAHAHAASIVHRDLKPSNVLVDESGRPRVLDFGVARLLDADPELATLQTRTGQVIGTLQYMSPEQAAGRPEDVDQRADVFALGVIAFELLSGQLPRDLSERPFPDAVRVVSEGETSLLGSVDRSLRGDIETIVAKALASEKERRYATAGDLAQDLRRHLANEPITARPSSGLYRLGRFVKRNRGLSAGLGLTALALAMGSVVSFALFLESRANEREARWQSFVGSVSGANAQLESGSVGNAPQLLESCPDEYKDTWEWRYLDNKKDSSVSQTQVCGAMVHAVAVDPSGRYLATGGGRSLAGNVGARDFRVRLWEITSELGLKHLRDPGTHSNAVEELAFHPETGQLVSFSKPFHQQLDGIEPVVAPGEMRVWDLDGGLQQSLDWPLGVEPRTVAWLPDGGSVAVGTTTAVAVWDIATNEVAVLWPAQMVNALAFAEYGSTLAIAQADGRLLFGAMTDDEPRSIDLRRLIQRDLTVPSEAGVTSVCVSPEGDRVLAGLQGGGVAIVDVASCEVTGVLRGHTGNVMDVRFQKDERRAVTASLDGSVRLWDVDLVEPLEVLAGHGSYVTSLALDPRGEYIVSGSYDRTARFWRARSGSSFTRLFATPWRMNTAYTLAFSQQGDRLAWRPDPWTVEVTDLASGTSRFTLPPEGGVSRPPAGPRTEGIFVLVPRLGHDIAGIAFTPDGNRLYTVTRRGGHLRSSSLATGEIQTIGPALPHLSKAEFSHDVTRYAAAFLLEEGLRTQVCGVETGEVLPGCSWSDGGTMGFRFTPNDEALVYTTLDQKLLVREIDSGRIRLELAMPGDVADIALSPDGTLVAVATVEEADRELRLYDLTSGELVWARAGRAKAWALAFTPDGSRIVAGSFREGSVTLWDTLRGEITLRLQGHQGALQTVAVSPDGSRVAAADGAGVHSVWDGGPLRR